ncbi:hypothetical protein RR46_07453 [Papilio xuthus]|uniref:MADF domain-containing protein n=1 Tax=Papilio xuthus TaxID=66420 RepID=A0A194PWF2_PAPXU|nr:hypothetical protein RR46_07453 [Papilio xuthus]
MNMEWTKAETIKFINLLKGFPCLWNSQNKDFKNRQKRREALDYIAQESNTDTRAVKKKMVSLRTQYNREINKIRTKTHAGYEQPTSSWYAYDLLHFLKDNSSPKPAKDSFTITFTPNKKEEYGDPYDSGSNQSPTNTQQSQLSRRSKMRNSVNQMKTLNLLNHASNAIINRQKKDEFSIFGEAVASELRDIKSRKEVIELKKNIMDMIYITKMNILDTEKSTPTSPPPNSEANLNEKENTSGSSDIHSILGKVEVAMDGEWMNGDS